MSEIIMKFKNYYYEIPSVRYFEETNFSEEVSSYMMINFILIFLSHLFLNLKCNTIVHFLLILVSMALIVASILFISYKLIPLILMYRNGGFYQFYSLIDDNLIRNVWECYKNYFLGSFLILFFGLVTYFPYLTVHFSQFTFYPLILFLLFLTKNIPYLRKLMRIYLYICSPLFVILMVIAIGNFIFNFITSLEFIPDIETVELFSIVISAFLSLLIIMIIRHVTKPSSIRWKKGFKLTINILSFISEIVAVLSFLITIAGKENIDKNLWVFVACFSFCFSLFLKLLKMINSFYINRNEKKARVEFRKIMKNRNSVTTLSLKKCCYYGGNHFIDLIHTKPELLEKLTIEHSIDLDKISSDADQ